MKLSFWTCRRRERSFPPHFFPGQGKILITIEADCLNEPLTLKGTVMRSDDREPAVLKETAKRRAGIKSFDEKAHQFGVEFENTPRELLLLLSALSADRRRQSRISTQMKCRFRCDNKEYDAFILDLSKEGASISSTFRPPRQSEIFITVEADCLEEPLKLTGTVARSINVMAMFGRRTPNQFGVEFKNPPQGLLRLISALSSGLRLNG